MHAKRLGGVGVVSLLFAANLVASSGDVRLIEAVKQPDAGAVRALLQQGVDVDARSSDGSTALLWAAYRDDLETADLLIHAGADVNAVNELGVSALWLAANNVSAAMIARLATASADPNIAPPSGGTPLMRAVWGSEAEAVRTLLAFGADPNPAEPSHGQTALMFAVARRQPEIVKVLLDARADVHARSQVWRMPMQLCCPEYNGDPAGTVEGVEGGFTPLLFAARNGNVESARLLLAAGAKVTDATPAGSEVLAMAALNGQGEVAAFLLDHGADVNAARAGYTALHAAVLRADLALVKALLAHGADPNARLTQATTARRSTRDYAFNKLWMGATPFWLAAAFHDTAMMRVLLAAGADPLAAKDDGTTPLIGAAQWEGRRMVSRLGSPRRTPPGEEGTTLEAVKLALLMGADVNAANEDGNTALHRAATKRFNTVVQFLADSGARLEVKNTRGLTPMAAALQGFGGIFGVDVEGFPKGAFDLDTAVRLSGGGQETADLLRALGAKE